MLYVIISWFSIYSYYKYFDPDEYNKYSNEYWVLLMMTGALFAIGYELERIRKDINK